MRHSGEQTHSCPFCGLSFSGKERLKEHWLRVEHVPVGGAPFECTRCSKTFVSLVLLKEHQRVHAAIKTFSCPICGPSKLFPYQSKLDRHIAQVHSSRRSFQCTVCSYASKCKSDLKRHTERHSTVAYKCDQTNCLESFSTLGNLRCHVRKVHGGLDKKEDFVCHVCCKIYHYKNSLSRHLESIHRLEPAPPSLRFQFETKENGNRIAVNAVPITAGEANTRIQAQTEGGDADGT
ncbi:zinc finger protein 782-like [Artemia franciscana]|uniref:zinc finger protein 782-like n=1 Tax=Artemia franciscana TaxID=6661 RepID=UPI0032DABCC7